MKTVRKTTVLLIIMTLVLMLATPAFAESSPIADGTVVLDGDGNAVSATVYPIAESDPFYQSAKQEISITSAQELIGVWNITPQGNPPYTIKIPIGAGYAGATVYHFNGSSWEELPSSYADGYAIGTSQSASPFGVVVQKAAPATNAAGNTANSSGSSGSSSVSPKTGDDSTMYYLIPLMVIAAAVCVFAGRKAVKARG